MARLATSAAHFCQRLQELYPQKLAFSNKQSEQSSPFRRWTTGSGSGSSYRHHDRNLYHKPMSEGSTAPASSSMSPNSGSPAHVTQWSLGLERLLADPRGAAAFAQFLAKEFAHENIRFWWACEKYRNTTNVATRAAMAAEIWAKYLADGAPEAVNVDASARRATALRINIDPSPPDLFETVQNHIFNVMKFDSYPRFLRSDTHSKSARGELVARPSTTTLMERDTMPILVDTDADAGYTPTRIRKSASNASERRRSGGSSLLPWRLRAGSRDRTAPAGTTATVTATAPAPAVTNTTAPTTSGLLVTDVVKAQPGHCSLCRVVLPDGATSVVGVDPPVTVRRMVDRLLLRRNLQCPAYDVIMRDSAGNQTELIDVQQSSTVVGGREVVVERRCVVRIEVGGRCVAVRCRPARRLRHVLRPVMARYWPQSQQHPQRAVLRDNTVLHPDTPMLELDGARLQIVELSEGVECLKISQEEDTDSLSDLAVRLQDDRDDELSNTGKSNRTRFEDQNQASNAGAGSNAASFASSSGVNCGSSSSGVNCGSSSSGRVRAALRQGAPLHHHPPDFLENLRETQRQRLQNKPSEPAPAPAPAPSPRTPPPLPPKPSQRTPTLV